jgi:hypothetical protein
VGAVDPSKVSLQKGPWSDGTVRTFVQASPGWLTVSGGSEIGSIQLVAMDSPRPTGTVLGSGPMQVSPDPLVNGSVAPFALSIPITQASLYAVDPLGNATAVTGYPEQVELSFVGKAVVGSENPIQAFDATAS